MKKSFVLGAFVFLTAGCAVDANVEETGSVEQGYSAKKSKVGTLDAPTLYTATPTKEGGGMEIEICAGPSGMPGGFTIQWDGGEARWPRSPCDDGFNGVAAQLSFSEEHMAYCTRVIVGAPYFTESLEDTCAAGIPQCGAARFRAFAQATSSMYASSWSNEAYGHHWCD